MRFITPSLPVRQAGPTLPLKEKGATPLSVSERGWGWGDTEFIGRRIEPAPRLAGDEVVKGKVFRDAHNFYLFQIKK